MVSIICVMGQSSYVFHHLSTSEGLSNNHVKSIIKDSYGFLWVGTESGLNRYDGYHFKLYASSPDNDNFSLGDDIQSLQEDKSGSIWIDTNNDYVIYAREKDCIVNNLSNELSKKGIYTSHVDEVYVDKNKDLWVLHGDSLQYYRFSDNQLNNFICPMKEVSTIIDNGKELFLLCQSRILYILDMQTGELQKDDFPEFMTGKIKEETGKIYIDNENVVWLYFGHYLFYKESRSGTWKEVRYLPDETTEKRLITSILDDGNGKIWIATDKKDLFIHDRQNNKQEHLTHNLWKPSSILAGTIETFYLDDLGTIWMGSDKGLSFYHAAFQNFFSYRNENFKDVKAILEDRHGNVWFGTDGYGVVCKMKNKDGVYRQFDVPGNVVVSLYEDSKGRIWIGTYQNGLICYEKGRTNIYTKDNSKLSDNSIWSIIEDRYGYLWIGTLWGTLHRFNPDSYEFETHLLNGENLTVMDMYYKDGDLLYAGTSEGVCIINIITGKKTLYTGNAKETQRYQHPFVQSLYKDKDDILWIGNNYGLTAWDLKRDTLYFINKNNGLCDNVIRAISEDALQHLWVTTSNGCSVLKTSVSANGEFTYESGNFSQKDGLPGNDFSRHAICKLRNNDMLLGMVDGYTLINPYLINQKSKPLAHITFTGLKIDNIPIAVDSLYRNRRLLDRPMEQMQELKLNYSDMLITIEYSAMDLLAANKVRYAYRLENLNHQWIYTSDTKITYTSLPPGKYRLLIKACNSDGVWNEDASALNIIVKPPFWLSVYAYIFYALLIAGFVIGWRRRILKKHQNKLEKQRLILEQEQVVRINEMKLKFFTNISHDFRTPLTLIITPLRMMMQKIKDEGILKKTEVILRSAEQLLHLVNELLDFRKLDVGAETLHPKQGDFVSFVKETATAFNVYASDRNMDFSISDEIESINMLFDSNKIQKIITNLLSNAFKYTQDEGRIIVRIFLQEGSVGVSIIDSGIGIPDEDKKHIFERFYQTSQKQEKTGSGIGLHIANEYVRLHGGTITVSDNAPHGSIFTFTIPIIVSDGKEDSLTDLFTEEENSEVLAEKRPVLLLVEDNKDFREFMSESLSEEFDVLTAGDGREALVCLDVNDVDFVISDVMMPIMDGFELCKRIKTNINLSHIPVILLTARTTEEYKIKGLEYGADDYITKPFNFDLLKLRIRKFMELNTNRHHAFNQKIDINPSEITITSLDEQLLTKAIKIVEEHMDNTELSVEMLSSAVGLTRGHLYKKLTYITGKGPQEFIRTIRLKRSKQLLKESQMQIAEIAYAVGFNSPKIFARSFRNEFGILPSEYAKNRK